MKKATSVAIIFILLTTMYFQIFSQASASSDSFIEMELNKTTVEVNDIITATIKINNIPKFSGLQVNIKFDPEVLQAVDPISGKPYNNSTLPLAGELLNNSEFISFAQATNDLKNGIINISKSYLNLEAYREKELMKKQDRLLL